MCFRFGVSVYLRRVGLEDGRDGNKKNGVCGASLRPFFDMHPNREFKKPTTHESVYISFDGKTTLLCIIDEATNI